MQKRNKFIIIMLLLILLISTFFVVVNKKEEKGKVGDAKETIEELDEKEEVKEEIIEETEEEQFNRADSIAKEDNQTNNSSTINSNNNSTKNNSSQSSNSSGNSSQSNQSSSDSNNQTSSSKSINNNSQASTSRTDDKTVDTSHPEYYIHQGKIDCTDSLDCMDISLPIQFKYKKVIANTYYVEVIAKDGTVLGYFIEYVFKDYTYSSDEECNQIGNEIKSTLSDRVTGFSCNSGILKIITNY